MPCPRTQVKWSEDFFFRLVCCLHPHKFFGQLIDFQEFNCFYDVKFRSVISDNSAYYVSIYKGHNDFR